MNHDLKQSPQPERGSVLIEVGIAIALLATGLTAVAGVLSTSMQNGARSQQINTGTRFLEGVLSSLDAQDNSAVLAMNGNAFFDRGTQAQSSHRVHLTATRVGLSGINVVLVLTRLDAGVEVARIATFRADR
jgi:Tfp pilus assembly protein PilV